MWDGVLTRTTSRTTEAKQHIMTRLDHRGHGPVARWSDDAKTHDAAIRVFAEHRARGYTMYDISNGVGEKLERFNPEAEEILAVPRMQAG